MDTSVWMGVEYKMGLLEIGSVCYETGFLRLWILTSGRVL
jgi:hypothetical protein